VKAALYPFSAIVGQEQMKLALLLAAIDWRLGVLLRGEKGAGKTTTARALAVLLPEPAPFVNLPIGVTEDRLLGGLHLESTLQGNPVLKPGLLSEAHGGVLYIDEVNLLPGHLGDALLDAASSGINVVEREGFSVSHPSEFVLLGSMNPEEGLLRPQLLDRFALAVDIFAPLEPAERRMIVERRIAFEREPEKFAAEWSVDENRLRDTIRHARLQVGSVHCSSEILSQIGDAVCAAGVRSLRADLATVRASIAYAALVNAGEVEAHHVEAVLPLVLNHRSKAGGRPTPPPPPSPTPREQPEAPTPNQDTKQDAKQAVERIFAPAETAAPLIESAQHNLIQRGRSHSTPAAQPGPVVGSRPSENPREMDLRATLQHAFAETGSLQPRLQDLKEKVREPKAAIRYVFLVDSSGSHAAQEKMRLVKGAILGLLERSFRKDDEVVLIAFRGSDAQVLLEPSRLIEDAAIALEYLPTGGRTPLAHALVLAQNYVTPSTILIVLSDGHANVALRDGDPWRDALECAEQLHCHSLVIDTEYPAHPLRRASLLADALRGSLVNLAGLEDLDVMQLKASTA
jgi:magnesium chelatase subunit D